MEHKLYNKTNFHKHTFCIFNEVSFSEIENLKVNYISKSGSVYYFTNDGVYRLSNHWSRVANCRWRLISNSNEKTLNSNRNKLGFALWIDFYADNEFEKLYFIEVNFELKEFNYFHKNCSNYKPKYQLRTATETAKIVKQIRNLLETDSWAKYINGDIDDLRKQIIVELITTNKSLLEIKKNYL
jgi:hypothetical protein